MFTKAFSNFPVLTTERLVLREIQETDLDQTYEIFSSIEVAQFSSHSPVESKDTIANGIKRWKQEYNDKTQVRWGIARRDDNVIIGTCCLGDFDEDAKRCEIGYHLAYKEWNKGFMTEALKAMICYAFEESDTHRIEAFVTPGNDASKTVLKKLGFVEEGLLRERDFFKGQYQDGIVFGMLRRDFQDSREK